MLVFQKNGIDFVTDLIWQKHNEENKVSLKQIKAQCDFNLYCKTNKIITTYGFTRLGRAKDDLSEFEHKKKKIKRPVSLALFLINGSDLDKETDDLFICFRFDEKRFGYLFLYKGSIFPERGEFIGDEETVKSRVKDLSHTYGVKTARILDDVPFHDNKNFEDEAGLRIIVIPSYRENDKFIPASDYYFWRNRGFKRMVSNAELRPLTLLQKQHKILLTIISFTAIIGLAAWVKHSYFNESDEIRQVVNNYIPVNTSGVPAKILIDNCLRNIDLYLMPPKGWSFNYLKCNLTGLEINYIANGGKEVELKTVIKDKDLIFKSGTATLHKAFSLIKTQPTKSGQDLSQQVDDLTEMGAKFNFTFNISQTPKVQIQSSFSPIFLYNKQVINNINLSEISMQLDNNGFFDWTIEGEFNGQK